MKEAFFTILGAVISGLIGWRTSIWQIRRNAKDQLRVFISQKIAAIPKEGCLAFYIKTKQEIRSAIFSVFPFVNNGKIASLNLAWAKYEAIEGHLNDETEEFVSLRSQALVQDGKEPIPMPSRMIKSHLEQIMNSF
jgi:hypothetical protein